MSVQGLAANRIDSLAPDHRARPSVVGRLMLEGLAPMDVKGDCIIWPRRIDRRGYGRASGGRFAHKVAYEKVYGPVPPGLELDHLCRNRACFNPEHLEPVTHKVNMQRGSIGSRTSCQNGHEYTAENTRVEITGNRTRRRCRQCDMQRQQACRARQAGGVTPK